MWYWVGRGNIQQISYIPQTEQHSPFGLMLLCLGNVTTVDRENFAIKIILRSRSTAKIEHAKNKITRR